jgi:chemotaxis protein MotB
MAARAPSKRPPAGAPAWLVTFADLMSLLVAFFVLIISFSVPDIQKLKIIAGSLRNAFGITLDASVTGLMELDGDPRYKYARDLVPIRLEEVVGPTPDRRDDITRLAAREEYWARILEAQDEEGADSDDADAAQLDALERELREAIQAMPELAALTDNLHFDRAPDGLRIQLLDQARMSMFPLGSAQMYEPTRKLLAEVVRGIAALPHRVAIAGHTDSLGFRRRDGFDNWSLSLARADATRRVVLESGLPPARLAAVSGKADTDHLFPDDPTDPRNRRISITLLREAPRAPQ